MKQDKWGIRSRAINFEHVSPSPDYIDERLRVYAPHAQLTLADDE